MQTLYTICLETAADHAEYITDWSNIPLDPFVIDIIRAISEKESRIKSVIYERIGIAHGARLPDHLGAVSLVGRDRLSLRDATQLIPRFITHLNLSDVRGINDMAIILLKPCVNLPVLDLTRTDITDMGVSHLARMTDSVSTSTADGNELYGLKHLQVLGLTANTLSDRCLKHLAKITTLQAVDLSYTDVTDVAIQFMKRHQYEVLYAVSPPPTPRPQMVISSPRQKRKIIRIADDDDSTASLITWCDMYGENGNKRQKGALDYLIAKQRNPACNIELNRALFRFIGRPLPPLRKHNGVKGSYFGDLSFVRQVSQPVHDVTESRATLSAASAAAPSRGKKRLRKSSPTPPPPPPARKQSWPNALDYLKMVEKDLGI